MHFQHLGRIKTLAETIPVVLWIFIECYITHTWHTNSTNLYTPWKAAAMTDFHWKSNKKTELPKKISQIAIYFSQNKDTAHWQKEQVLQRCGVATYKYSNNSNVSLHILGSQCRLVQLIIFIHRNGKSVKTQEFGWICEDDCHRWWWRFKKQAGCNFCFYTHCTPLDLAHVSLQKLQVHKVRSQIWANIEPLAVL